MAISNLDSAQSLFVGQGDLIIFNEINDYGTADLSSLTNPKSLGQIHEDSSDWTGDDVSIEEIRDEQGDLITATVSAGTLAYEFNIASTSDMVIQTFLKGIGIPSAALASIWETPEGGTAPTVSAVGFGIDLPVITRPIGWLNDEKKRMLLFPKGKITANLAINDGLLEVHCAVLAEYVDRPTLKTGMIFTSSAAASYATE